jgi:hypothetical protein
MGDEKRKDTVLDFEADAEVLFAQHLDLLAQMEAELRAVHHTMRHIERLRGPRFRVGPELLNGEREIILTEVSRELQELDRQISVEHDCCGQMHTTIADMKERVAILKRLAVRARDAQDSSASGESGNAP